MLCSHSYRECLLVLAEEYLGLKFPCFLWRQHMMPMTVVPVGGPSSLFYAPPCKTQKTLRNSDENQYKVIIRLKK